MNATAPGLLRARWVHVTFAVIAMGGWAFFVNRGHGVEEGLRAAVVQGAASGAITAVLKAVLDWLGGRFSRPAAFILPPVTTASSVLVLLIAAHWALDTPRILATIVVPWSVSTLYAILYAADVERRRR